MTKVNGMGPSRRPPIQWENRVIEYLREENWDIKRIAVHKDEVY